MSEVKHSLKIESANLKNFSVTVESDGTTETLRLCDFFMAFVERGVHVQIVCMKPFGFYLYAKKTVLNFWRILFSSYAAMSITT